ncbi:MAG: hypothetical protein RMM53_03020 [Bacteroidia bacterium]|nr:hypothetical protein [Bacteroidia bacterium]MDW8333170.1 hypothetical protein [Bacteroidia bacterium]
MLKETLKELMAVEGYPCVSILLPTHRTFPDNQQDPILLKNLIKEVETRLSAEFNKRETEAIVGYLNVMAGSIDHNYNLDGLALYAAKDYARKVVLPFSVRARTVVDRTFATRDLIMAFNRSVHYYVLVLTSEEARLFEAYRETLYPVRHGGFPVEMFYKKGSTAPKNAGGRENQVKEFFNRVDKLMQRAYNAESLPVVVVGTERNVATFMEMADRKEMYAAHLHGNHDHTTPHDLGRMTWPLVSELAHRHCMGMLDTLKSAVSAGKSASGLTQVWRMAHEGRGDLLLAEEGYSQGVILDENGTPIPVPDPTAPGVIDDAVDEIAEAVIRYGGQVAFVPDGTLEEHARIALTLRY